jgi:hypothetical protein
MIPGFVITNLDYNFGTKLFFEKPERSKSIIMAVFDERSSRLLGFPKTHSAKTQQLNLEKA